jgi:hypothetical protein
LCLISLFCAFSPIFAGCLFFCQVTDTSCVKVNLRHLELIWIEEPASFMMHVDGTTPAELGISVRAPSLSTLPVKVNKTTRTGFRGEFAPKEVGAHTVSSCTYNGTAVVAWVRARRGTTVRRKGPLLDRV